MKSKSTLLKIVLLSILVTFGCKSRDSNLKTTNLTTANSESKLEFSAGTKSLKVKLVCGNNETECKESDIKFNFNNALKSIEQDLQFRLKSTNISLSINGTQASLSGDTLSDLIKNEKRQLLAERDHLQGLLSNLESDLDTLKTTPLTISSNLHVLSNASANKASLLGDFYHRRKAMVTSPGELWFWAGRGVQLFGSANRCNTFFVGSRLPTSAELIQNQSKLEELIVSRLKWSPDVALYAWASDVPPIKPQVNVNPVGVVAWTHGLYANDIAGRLQRATDTAGLFCVVKLLVPVKKAAG